MLPSGNLRAAILKISKMGRNVSWALTKTQEQWVRANAANKSTNEMAEALNVCRQFLYRWMWDRGIEPMVIPRSRKRREQVMPGYFNIEEFQQHYKW